MVTVSRWYDEMFKNWWLWYKRLELGMETIVIAEDEWIFQKYQNESSFKLVYFAMEQVVNLIIILRLHFKVLLIPFLLRYQMIWDPIWNTTSQDSINSPAGGPTIYYSL